MHINIHLTNVSSFLQALNEYKEETVYISAKLSRKDIPQYLGILLGDDAYVLQDAHLERNISSLLLSSLQNKSVCLYDLKYFLKFISEEDRFSPVFLSAKDLKIQLYNLFSKNISLESEEVLSLTSIKLNSKITSFIQANSGLNMPVYEIYPKDQMVELIAGELKIISSLDKKISRYSDNIKNSSIFYRYTNRGSVGYSFVEQSKVYLLEDVDYPLSRKSYEDYLDKERYASIRYDLDHSITGRISSRFHSLGKEGRNKIISRFPSGSILKADFSCFEIKVVLDILEIEIKVDDIYSYLASEVGLNRDDLKKQLIGYIYGSTSIKPETKRIFEEMLNISSSAEKLKNGIKNRCYNTTMGRLIEYADAETCQKKYINGEVQSTAQLYMYDYIFSIYKLLRDSKLKSKVVYTVYDSVAIDCPAEEVEIIYPLLKKATESCLMDSKYVNFTPKLVGDD